MAINENAVTDTLTPTTGTLNISGNLTVSGTFPINNGPAFSVWANTATNTATGTQTKVVFNTVEFDTNSNYSTANNRFTPTVAGYYQINASVFAAGYATQITYIFKNGSEYKRTGQQTGAYLQGIPISSLVYCNGSTDYIEIYWYQASGSTVNSGIGQSLTWFNGSMVRSA